MIDGYPVRVGDIVYVLGLGHGSVVATTSDGGFTVKIAGGEQYYSTGGYIGKQRRVYWDNPIVINPPRNARLWAAYLGISKTIYSQLTSIFNSGKVPDSNDTVNQG